MRMSIIAVTAAALALGPAAATARAVSLVPVAQRPIPDETLGPAQAIGLDSKKTAAIGAGIVVGAIAGYYALSFQGATAVGAIVGALVAIGGTATSGWSRWRIFQRSSTRRRPEGAPRVNRSLIIQR